MQMKLVQKMNSGAQQPQSLHADWPVGLAEIAVVSRMVTNMVMDARCIVPGADEMGVDCLLKIRTIYI